MAKEKFRDFSDRELVQALFACSGKYGPRCSNCPIFGKGFQGRCTSLLMKTVAEKLNELTGVKGS